LKEIKNLPLRNFQTLPLPGTDVTKLFLNILNGKLGCFANKNLYPSQTFPRLRPMCIKSAKALSE